MNAEYYIATVLTQKGSCIRKTPVHVGEFIYDYNGDLIGHYAGNGQIVEINKLNAEVLEKIDGKSNER